MTSKPLTATHIAYYHLCQRKLWLFDRGLQMEQESDAVRMGKQVSEDTYQREDKERTIDGVIVLDWVKNGVVHEVKKSNKVEYAHEAQVLYYLWYLDHKGLSGFTGRIDYPLLKQTKDVILTDDKRREVERWIAEATAILAQTYPPPVNKKRICKRCSYYELCYV